MEDKARPIVMIVYSYCGAGNFGGSLVDYFSPNIIFKSMSTTQDKIDNIRRSMQEQKQELNKLENELNKEKNPISMSFRDWANSNRSVTIRPDSFSCRDVRIVLEKKEDSQSTLVPNLCKLGDFYALRFFDESFQWVEVKE